MTISGDDVRRLLEAEPDAVLVLLEGRVEVVGGRDADDDAHRGALEVISRADLIERTGGEQLSDHEVSEQAAALDVAVTELGG
jgi:NADH dehydrogenase